MTAIIVVQGKHREKPYAIWRNSDTDIWACEDFATLTHYDGTSWTKHDIGKKVVIRCIWGSSSSDIWACGSNGTVLHYDGTSWKEHHFDNQRSGLYLIWGSSSNDIWIGGFSTLLHYDGTSWTKHDIGENTHIRAIWGNSSNDIWARVLYVSVPEPLQFSKADKGFKIMINEGKEALLHYDGTTWTKHDPFDIDCTS